jgi:oligosaccharide translocation protein RFT1
MLPLLPSRHNLSSYHLALPPFFAATEMRCTHALQITTIMSNAATTAAARGTLLSILLRLLSFLLSQLTVRFVSASTLGKASIPLELLLGTALFVGREGFRLGLTKELGDDVCSSEGDNTAKKRNEEHQQQKIVNVSWLSVPIGALLSLCALMFHLYSCQHQVVEHEWEKVDYKLAGILYCLASFVESLAEPLVISCLQRLDVATKAKAEGVALLAQGISCFGALILLTTSRYRFSVVPTITKLIGVESIIDIDSDATFSVSAFGISQLMYAIAFTVIMYRKIDASPEGIRWPKLIDTTTLVENPYRNNTQLDKQRSTHWLLLLRQHLDLHTLYLVVIFTLQGLFKHALTEADKIVLSALTDSYDQGVYALASSYGGLAARLLLQPLEENARLLFSRQGALIAKHQSTKDDDKDGVQLLVQDLERTYYSLIRGVLYVGLVFASIATNYTSLLLRILAGNRWGSNSEASDALSAFCVYTAFMAINGTTEAFVYGVARSGKAVGQLGLVHALIGGVFALISPCLVRRKGAVGLVTANCICMGLRSAYSLYYANAYFGRIDGKTNVRLGGVTMLAKTVPHPVVLGIFVASYATTKASMTSNYDLPIARGTNWIVPALTHVSVGAACTVVVIGVSLYLEDDFRAALFKLKGRKSKDSSSSATTKPKAESTLTLSQHYMNLMEKHELLTKSITAGVLGIVGDIFAQGIEQHLERDGRTTISDLITLYSSLDKRRTLAMFGDGLFTGPLLHFIYELYETLLPLSDDEESDTPKRVSRRRFYLTIAHVLIDNTIMALVYVFLTMCTTAIFEGHFETIPDELRNDFISAVKASWASSIGLAPMQLLSFLYLPKEFKVLAVNIQDIVWVAVISYATHLNRH